MKCLNEKCFYNQSNNCVLDKKPHTVTCRGRYIKVKNTPPRLRLKCLRLIKCHKIGAISER